MKQESETRDYETENNSADGNVKSISEDDFLEAVAQGKISGCEAFRTLARAVKSDEE